MNNISIDYFDIIRRGNNKIKLLILLVEFLIKGFYHLYSYILLSYMYFKTIIVF